VLRRDGSPPWVCIAAGAALLAGIAALGLPPQRSAGEPISWESLLAPYSLGAPLPDGFRIGGIRRGPGNDVIVFVDRPGDRAAIELHVLSRGRWTGVRESQSFGIGYETPHSSAPEREAITEVLAETIRSHDHGLPSPDAIPLGPAFDTSVLPWWLEMLRGGQGLLLGASLVLLALIALVSSPGLACAGLALGATDLLARVAGVPFGRHDVGAAWATPASVLLLVLARRRRPVATAQDRLLALAVVGTGLALRLVLGPWGPLRINGIAPLWVTGAARDPAAIATYGPGYVEIFGPIAALAPSSPDWAIFASNALLSALVPALAFALGRLAGVSRRAALAAALLLAIDPVALRMAATESYFPAIIFLCTGAGVALLVAGSEMEVGGRWRAAACVGAAGLLLVQAARIHPSAWGLIATVPFVILAGGAGSLPRRILVFLASAGIIGGLLVVISGDVLLDILGNVRGGTLMRPPAPPSLRPLACIAVAAAAYAVLAPQRWLAVAAGLSVAGLLMTRHVYGQSWIWQHCYDRLYLTVPVVAAVGAVPVALWRHRSIVLAFTLLVGVAWFRIGLPIISARTTDHLEYRWLREQLAQLPPECRVIHLASAGKRGLVLPTYVGPRFRAAVAMDEHEPHTIAEGLAPAACLYYVHTSLCSSAEGRPACEALERRLALVPVARASFPARPSNEGLPYDRDMVETVIARVQQVSSAGADLH
jgi:hypothetical protein